MYHHTVILCDPMYDVRTSTTSTAGTGGMVLTNWYFHYITVPAAAAARVVYQYTL